MDNYYELHVTVLPERILDFATFCKYQDSEAKPLYIQLSKGLHKNQLMLAATTMLPNDMAAKCWAMEYGQRVDQKFTVTRVKLESRLVEGPNEYYEAHWKLDFPFGDWENQIDAFLVDKPHLLRSENLFNPRIQYLSQRIYGSSDPLVSSRKFNASGIEINFGGLPLVKTHYERCVWDSNPALDFGWA
jgi:hypothetical protein